MRTPGSEEAAESSKFFEHGEAVLEESDYATRMASVRIRMPCCLMQAVTPSLLGGGLLDELKIMEPVAVWIPQLSDQRVSPAVRARLPDAHVRINSGMRAHVDELLKLFKGAASVVLDPADLVPCLPLGTYVQFRFRCRVDDVPKILEGVQSTAVAGVPEFQWALAMVLRCALEDFERHEARKALL
ncbi:MAG: hypothetical protein BWY99_01678 [Synergistetes bacterium ADurb.BinA166]|nr:MAG: hypothetical protein BWY99_01678 [Synergistetes bacterium ADurb.BinA166]